MTNVKCYGNMEPCTTVLSADPHKKGENDVDQQKITILFWRLSNEDSLDGESNSIGNQEEICQGGISPSEAPSINWKLSISSFLLLVQAAHHT